MRARFDSARAAISRDSARADSARAARIRRQAEIRADSIKSPTARSEMPVLTDIGERLHWDRAALFSSGAVTLTELLDRIPGMTGFRSGWLASPQQVAYFGDFTRVRVFYDGLEIDPLDPRNNGIHDLSSVQLWPLEEVSIERGATEVRVHLRSWRVRSTTPSTRVDVSTGDLETNTYRGFYGKRFRRGQVLQLGAYQLSTADTRNGGDADQVSMFGRAGIARGNLSIDGSFLRTHRDRAEQLRREEFDRPNLVRLDATTTTGYIRAAYGDYDRGLWAQAIAGTVSFKKAGGDSLVLPPAGETDTVVVRTDTTRTVAQYVLATGWTEGPLRVSATARARRLSGFTYVSPMVRAAYDLPWLAVSVLGETSADTRVRRVEGSARYLPLPYLALGGAVSQTASTADSAEFPSFTGYRAEAGVRLGRVWLTGGVLTRDTAILVAPVVFDTGFRGGTQGAVNGTFATIRGRVWKDVGVDIMGVRWADSGLFRPKYQARSRLYVHTAWRKKFPSGNLNILAAFTHDYRSPALFPVATDDGTTILESKQYREWGFQLEIRLLQATLSYQFRNFYNEQYDQVPGFQMPRPLNFYGVRWDFFN
jgi:hypothetical protein